MTLKIGVIGKTGQLARSFADLKSPHDFFFCGRESCDLEDTDNIHAKLDQYFLDKNCDIIFNTAAYTQVDQAEAEPELAHKINSLAPARIAEWAKINTALFVHYSTDYVYPGTGDHEVSEGHETSPTNTYGKTKLEGEKLVQDAYPESVIIRTSWVFSPYGNNFLLKMLEIQPKFTELKIVADQFGSPTYAPDLAATSLKLVEQLCQSKPTKNLVIHICNQGTTNWLDFAQEIFSQAKKMGIIDSIPKLKPVTTEEFAAPAPRPKNSRLSTEKLNSEFKIDIPTWKEAVSTCLTKLKES